MFRIARAAAAAATILIVVSGAAFAGPSVAGEYDALPATANIAEHSGAVPEIAPEDGVAISFPVAFDPNLTADIAEHVVAPIDFQAVLPAPAVKSGRSLVDLVKDHARSDVPDAEHDCLAGAVYFESKGEPLEGQLAVADVILNRAASGRFPTSICGVVKQKSQFSFVRGGRIPAIPRSSEAWRKAVAIAHIAKRDLAEGGIGKAMFFHARYVSPRWRLTRVASIGNHIFYR